MNFQWKTLFYRFLRNWYWFVISLLAIFLLTWLYLRSASPTYLVRGTFQLREEQYNSSFSQDVGIVIETQGAKMQQLFLDQTQIMKSLSLMQQVVDTLDIDIQYFIDGRLKKTELYDKQVPFKVTQAFPRVNFNKKKLRLVPVDEQRFGILKNEEDTLVCRYGVPFEFKNVTFNIERTGNVERFEHYEISFRDPLDVARYYSKKINFNPVAKSFIIAATLVDESPRKGIDIINTLLSIYNRTVVEDKNKVGQNTLQFIEERVLEMEKELFDIEKKVETYKRGEDIPLELSSSTQLLLTDVSSIEEEIGQLDLRIQLLEEFERTLRSDWDDYEFIPISGEIANSAVADLFEEYNSLISERERMLQEAGTNNPKVREIQERVADIRSNIFSGIGILKQELIRTKETQEARLAPYQQSIQSVPRKERELLDIQRQQKIKEDLYLFLLQTREQTRLNVATQVPDTKMIDEPRKQNLVFPKRIQIFLLSFFFAMAIPAGMLFIRESTDNNIYTKEDIASQTNTPFLGAIGQSRSKKPVVIRKSSRSAIAEMFRLLRTNLQFLLGNGKTPVVLITSATSGEGKTFIGINLGLSLALSDKKVVVVGTDLRKPKLSTYIKGEKSKEGLSNYLVGQKEKEELPQPTGLNDNFYYIGSGPIPPNPAELLMQDRMKELLEYLRSEFDFVIIDISPVGLVTDALLLEKLVDASIFVTRFKVTKKGTLRIIDDIYRQKKLPNPSIVLNGVKRTKAYGDGSYGYGYGYGYGYYEDEKEKKWLNLFRRRK